MRMSILAALVLFSASASASLIEDTTTQVHPDLHYQEDGGAQHPGGDAPDTCPEAHPDFTMDVGPDGIDAMLVQEDDESDVFITPIVPDLVGQRMVLNIVPSAGVAAYELGFDIFSIDCQDSVFDEESRFYNRSLQVPPEPVVPDEDEVVHTFNVGDHTCDPTEWKFMLQNTQVERPATLYVEYSDGSYEYVPLHQGSPSNVAKYHTSTNLEFTVVRVMAALPDWWDGKFVTSHGPCDVVEAPPIEGPVQEPLSGEFTVVEPGDYVLLVYIAKDAGETTQEKVDELVPPPSSIPVRCDRDLCSFAYREVEYDALLSPKENA